MFFAERDPLPKVDQHESSTPAGVGLWQSLFGGGAVDGRSNERSTKQPFGISFYESDRLAGVVVDSVTPGSIAHWSVGAGYTNRVYSWCASGAAFVLAT